MATINGTTGPNNLTGDDSDDVINAYGGNDTVQASGGADTVYGGDGNDTVYGGSGNDSLFGGLHNDVLYGEAGDDVILGDDGSDRLLDGGLGNDSIRGGNGDDTVFFRVGEGVDTIDGGVGFDSLTIEVTSSQLTAAIRADFETLASWVASPTGTLQLSALGLTLTSIEYLNILLDGQSVGIEALRNSAPEAGANTLSTSEDVEVSGNLIASDPEGGALTWQLLDGPSHGSLLIDASGAYVYDPENDYSGSDSFIVRVTDAGGLSTDQVVEIMVAPVIDTPILSASGVTVEIGSHQIGSPDADTLNGGVGEDTLIGGDGDDLLVGDDSGEVRQIALDITALTDDHDGSESLTIRILGLPADAYLSNGVLNEDGSWSLALSELAGLALLTARTQDFSILVEATATELELEGGTSTASITIPITFSQGNGNDSVDGGDGEDTIWGGHGSDTIDGGQGADWIDGGEGGDTIRYAFASGFDSISGGEDVDTLILELGAAHLTAGVRSDLAALDAWLQQQAGAADHSGDELTLDQIGVTLSMIEQVIVMLDGIEVDMASLQATAPTAEPLVSIATSEDAVIGGQLEAADADGDALAWALVAGPQHGTLSLDANGRYTYTPAANYHGTDSFTVAVSDPSGNSVEQEVAISIAAVNDAPTAAAELAIATNEDTAVSGQLVAGDVDGDRLAWALAANPQHGTVSLAADGRYTYRPAANFHGVDSFTVSVADPSGSTVQQVVAITVAAINDAPTAAPAVASATDEDTVVAGQLEAADVDGDALSWALVDGPQHGSVTLDAAGRYSYSPAANDSGSDSFTVSVSDPSGARVQQVVSIAIAAVADAPTLSVVAASVAAAAAMIAPSVVGTDGDDTLTGTSGADDISAGAGDDLVRGDSAATFGSVALDIRAALVDVDGSEVLSLRLSGLPAAASLSAGVRNADGSWSLTAAELAGLSLSAPAGTSFTLAVTATATEVSGDTATAQVAVEITVGTGTGGSGAGNDTLRGNVGDDTIYGGGGDDEIRGGWGSDLLYDEAGNDLVHGGRGDDVVHNGAGNDKVWAGKGNDILHDGAGDDVLHGDKGHDVIHAGAGNNIYDGGEGFDTLDLSAIGTALSIHVGEHKITGAGEWRFEHIEKIIGTARADSFVGSKGGNSFDGGAGHDAIRGGDGNDRLAGGTGNDTFLWTKQDARGDTDTILDFAAGDRLDLKAVLAGTSFASINSVVRVTDNAWGTSVSVKIDGKFSEVVKLEGFHASSAASMLAADMIIV